jgi:uridine kinase
VAVFDHRLDCPVATPEQTASPGDILLFDGIFLHRPELRAYWDYSIFLVVRFAISIPRGAQRGDGVSDIEDPYNHRYIRGQELYLLTEPARRATVVVNNEDLGRPYFVMPNDR